MPIGNTITLYHGTTQESASALINEGWKPNSGSMGGNGGNPRLLYLTTEPENALWFAEQKGGASVLEVRVQLDDLVVDPEDGVGETVEEEFEIARRNGTPANFACRRALQAECFADYVHAPSP